MPLLFPIPPSLRFLDELLFFLLRCTDRQQHRASRLPFYSPSFNFFLQYIATNLSPCAIFLPKASEKEGNYSWVLTGGPSGWWGRLGRCVVKEEGTQGSRVEAWDGVWKMWVIEMLPRRKKVDERNWFWRPESDGGLPQGGDGEQIPARVPIVGEGTGMEVKVYSISLSVSDTHTHTHNQLTYRVIQHILFPSGFGQNAPESRPASLIYSICS